MAKMIEKTLGTMLYDLSINYPDREAVKYTDRDYRRTWKELYEEAKLLAKGLLSIGIKKGDHISIWANNVPEWFLTMFATANIGCVLVTVNTNYRSFELEYLLRQSDTKLLVMNEGFKGIDYVEIINELCPELKTSAKDGCILTPRFPYLKNIIFGGNVTPEGMMNFEKLKELGQSISDEEYFAVANSVNCQDIVSLLYTSGTTGFPKGVMLTHFNIINNGDTIGSSMKFTAEDKLLIVVPFFHCFGLTLAIMACLTHASSMVPIDTYHPLKVMKALESEQCTAFHGVPTMFIAMLEHSEFRNFKFNLRTGIMAGSPCPIKVMEQVISEMGMKDVVIVFGQTEASPGCTMTTTDDSIEHRVNTVGRAFEGVECKIIDCETGKTLGAEQPGEFCARGYNIMKGYYKMPEATTQAIDKDGWLHSGDLCTVDKDGYYKVVGRIKDMIIRGGENIYPKELEEFMYTHPKVSDVQVVGVPSKRYGEEVMACIILKPNAEMTVEDVQEYFRKNMARHKIPKYVRFMEAFPVTASGKIQKFKLREEAIEIYNLNDEASIETA